MMIRPKQCISKDYRTQSFLLLIGFISLIATVYLYVFSSEVSGVSSHVFKKAKVSINTEQTRKITKPLQFKIPSTQQNERSTTKTLVHKATTIKDTITSVKAVPLTKAKTATTTAATSTARHPPIPNGCRFQNLNPYYPEIMEEVDDHEPINCSNGLPVLVYIDNASKLRVNFTKVNETIGRLDYCVYTRVDFSDKDDSQLRDFKWSRKFLYNPLQLTDKDEQIWVRCFLKNTVVGEMFKGRIQEKPEVEKRCEDNYKKHVDKYSPLETMSVLLVGMDGMSKQNLIRTMPKTRNYILNNLNARELNKFNKVGDNTFPNVLALHSGHYENELSDIWTGDQYFDDIEDKFTWHHYQEAGYRTGMGLDVTWMTAFHYLKKGWKKPTFDYYSRALRLAMDEEKNVTRKAGDNCVGETPELVVLQDYINQIAALFNNTRTKPYFIYNFYTKLTHDYQILARKADNIYLNFFQELHRKKVLNNTITMFFSDHGTRYGEFRETFNGRIETNTPFVYFMFPPWFERKYPEIMKTFQTNQNRLTTFFDINKTLRDLLKFDGKTKKGSLDFRAISLFDEIPIERTCKHAEIPIEYCNCRILSKDKVSDKVTNDVAKGLVEAIVEKTKDHRDICALLSLQSIKSILTMKTDDKMAPKYQVTVTTNPGGGMYEALIRYDPQKGNTSLIGDNIARLNLYKGQDACANTPDLKLYCFCKSVL